MDQGYDEGRRFRDGFSLPFECLKLETWANDVGTLLHYHEYIELLYVTDGDLNIWIGGNMFNFKTGDLVIVNSNEGHRIQSIQEISRYIVAKFLPQLLYSSEQSIFELKYIVPFIMESSEHQRVFKAAELAGSRVPQLMENIIDECDRCEFGYELAVRSDIMNIFLFIMRYWNSNGTLEAMLHVEGELNPALQSAILYTSRHFCDVSEREVAEHCGLSYSYFSRTFKRVMRMSFCDYVTYLRISEAEKQLIVSEKSVTDIAMELGYSTSSHFISQFKSRKGMSPKQFRSNFRKQFSN